MPTLTNGDNYNAPKDQDVEVCMEAIHNARMSRKQQLRQPTTAGYDFVGNGNNNINSIRMERNGFLHPNYKKTDMMMDETDSQPTMIVSNKLGASFVKVELPKSSTNHGK